VLLSGASPRSQRGLGAFQEIDQAAAARPVTKAAWVAEDATKLGHDMARALEIAQAGRPGPVHVSLPGDLLETSVSAGAPLRASVPARAAASEPIVREILAMLAEAKRPVIVAGAGTARGRRWLAVQRLAGAVGAPALPSESPRGLNDPWLHGANSRLAEADLVLLLGKALDFSLRFGRPPGFAAECRFVQVTAEATAPNPRATLTVVADPATVAEQLTSAAGGRVWPETGWADDVRRVRAAIPPAWQALRESLRTPMHPLAVCAALQPIVDGGAALVVDGGEFGQWVQAGVDAPVRLINGPSGSIGSAIPMAIAARLVHRDRPVIAALGDGTFGFHPLELDTALRHALPIVVVVGNDARWNAEHQLQIQHYGAERAIACTLLPTRYDRVAEAVGGHGEHVERADQLPSALARAIASGKPAVVNVVIDGVAAPTFSSGGAH
jgi:acetolactate synthase-1/2/3 large subunit